MGAFNSRAILEKIIIILKTILKNICRIFKFLWKEGFALLQCPWDEARKLDRQVTMFNRSAENRILR